MAIEGECRNPLLEFWRCPQVATIAWSDKNQLVHGGKRIPSTMMLLMRSRSIGVSRNLRSSFDGGCIEFLFMTSRFRACDLVDDQICVSGSRLLLNAVLSGNEPSVPCRD